MRAINFRKLDDGMWHARPFQGCAYRIVRHESSRYGPASGYTAYFNDKSIGVTATITEAKAICRDHLASDYPK